jgi:hypothetical protein
MNVFDELKKPFPEERIHWRVGATNARSVRRDNPNAKPTKGVALAYIDARDVMERLDETVGPDKWQCRYPFKGCCEIGILIGDTWIWRGNGAGETDVEGEKGQYSDAFKRAGVMWGIGRYLYALPNEWHELNERGHLKGQPKLPQWATPNGWNRISSDVKKTVYEQTVSCLENGDETGLMEIWSEWTTEEKPQLWRMFNSQQRGAIKELLNHT